MPPPKKDTLYGVREIAISISGSSAFQRVRKRSPSVDTRVRQ
jgi:hypothetical protein